MALAFFADELEAAGVMGCVSGVCEHAIFGGGFVLAGIDWSDAVFCDTSGDQVELCDCQKRDIAIAISDALAAYDSADAHLLGSVSLGRRSFAAA